LISSSFRFPEIRQPFAAHFYRRWQMVEAARKLVKEWILEQGLGYRNAAGKRIEALPDDFTPDGYQGPSRAEIIRWIRSELGFCRADAYDVLGVALFRLGDSDARIVRGSWLMAQIDTSIVREEIREQKKYAKRKAMLDQARAEIRARRQAGLTLEDTPEHS
jgi:hypothetical protein